MQQTDLLYKTDRTAGWYLKGWALWSIPALFYAYEFLHRVAPSVMTSQLREAFSVNDHQLGMIGAMYFYAYSAFQLPAGILIDRFGAKNLLVFASAILTLGSFLFATTDLSSMAHVSRFMIGMGSAFAFVGCLKIGAQILSMRSFPLVVGLTNLCGTLGALSGGIPLSYWIESMGWREVLIQVSFIGLAITILMWILIPGEAKTTTAAIRPAPAPGLFKGLKLVIKSRQSWILALYGALLVAPIAALPEMWGVEYLKTVYQIPSTEAAAITHTIFVGTAVGGPLIGWLASRYIKATDFMIFACLGALGLLCVFLYGNTIPSANLVPILFCYGLLTANMLLCFSLITQIHPHWAQGAAIGFINMIVMAGGGLAQHGVGWILHYLRSQHAGLYLVEDYHIALSVLPVCLLIASLLALFIKRQIKIPALS